MQNTIAMRPISFVRSLFFFGIPALIAAFFFWGLMPLLDLLGFKLLINFLISITGPFFILLLAAIRFYRKEGNPWNKEAFKARFRLRSMDLKSWLWTLVLVLILFASRNLLDFTRIWLEENLIAAPKILVRMMDPDPNYFMEVALPGNWMVLLAFLAHILVTVAGSEFWWRGLILPRQELAFGSSAWIVHGLLWTCFYAFVPWELIRFLPGAVALSFVVQKTKNTSIGLVALFALQVPMLVTIVTNIIR